MIIFHKPVGGLSEAALSRFVSRAQRTARLRGHVNVLITTSRDLRSLNRQFRGKDEPTDVLSFPAEERGKPVSVRTRVRELRGEFLGDIAISPAVARRNAHSVGRSLSGEIHALILHGILHLLGYDHETDRGEMDRVEGRLRRRLGLA